MINYEALAMRIWDEAIDNKSARRIVAMLQQMAHDGDDEQAIVDAVERELAA